MRRRWSSVSRNESKSALAGNRTRVSSVAGIRRTTWPQVLIVIIIGIIYLGHSRRQHRIKSSRHQCQVGIKGKKWRCRHLDVVSHQKVDTWTSWSHQHDKVASVSLKEKSWHLRKASKCLVWASICGKVHCSALYWNWKEESHCCVVLCKEWK